MHLLIRFGTGIFGESLLGNIMYFIYTDLFVVRLNFIFLHSQVSKRKNNILEMYAIVDIAGQQMKVEKDQKIFVNRLQGKEGSKVDFDQILLIDDNGKVKVGTPVVKDMVVTATIVSHLKGDKVKVFKKKRRKGYKVLNGHRQLLTELVIEKIAAGKAKTTEKQVKAEPKTKSQVAPKASKSVEKKEIKPKAAAEKKETKPKTATQTKPAAKKETKSSTAAKAKTTAVKKEAKTETKPKATTAKKTETTKTKKPASKKKES